MTDHPMEPVTKVRSPRPWRHGIRVPPILLPTAAAVLLASYYASSGPAAYMVGRGWIPWETYRAAYSPIDEVLWGSKLHLLTDEYRTWWRRLADRHNPIKSGHGFPTPNGGSIMIRSRSNDRRVHPTDPDFSRLGGTGDDIVVVIESRVIVISPGEIRVDGDKVLDCLRDSDIDIESDNGELTIEVEGLDEIYRE